MVQAARRWDGWLAALIGDAGDDRCDLELKFVLPESSTPAAAAHLAARLARDGSHPDNEIGGLYFDHPDLRSLAEKLAGDCEKLKVRLRWYQDPAGLRPRSPVYLELKARRGRSRRKWRREVELDLDAWLRRPLEDPAWLDLPRRLAPASLGVPVGLVPTVLLRYRRRRFVDRASGARVALDAGLRAEAYHRGLFPGLLPPPRVPETIIEVKDTAQVPAALAFLPALGARASAFSKYSACLGLH